MVELDNLVSEYFEQGKIVSFGTVLSVDNDKALVQTEDDAGCSGCGSKGGCGTASLSSLFVPSVKRALEVENRLQALVGDRVVLSMVESDVLKHSIMAYGIPLVFLMFGAWLGLNIFHSDLLSAILGFTFLGVGWLFTKYAYEPVLPKLEKIVKENI